MHHSDSLISQAAAILAARRAGGEQGPRLPQALRPSDIDSALAIQAAVAERSGARIAGWKCGMPADGRVTLAPIGAADMHAMSPCAAWARAGQVRIEPELAFILGCDLPARERPYAPAEVDAAIARTHLALELIDCRYDDADAAGFLEHLADGLFNQGLFLGPQVDGERARRCSVMPIRVTPGAGPQIEFDGRHPAADPRAPLYWLAEFLRSRGQGLQAGQAVITGSYVAAFDVPPGQEIAIRYGDLGDLAVRFTPR
jgi:2-keto-4-pentenoate hydratase